MLSFNDAQFLFEERHNEMEEFLNRFHQLANKSQDSIDRDSFDIIKSNILLMQYNVIESSFLELYKTFYNFLKDSTLSLDSLNKSFSYHIYSIIKRSAQHKHEKLKSRLSSSDLNFSNCAMSICFDLDDEEKKFLVNGNLDGKKIKEFFQEFGIDVSTLENLNLSPLRTLKDNRQLLAHGGSSFSSVGKEISWDTLISNSQLIKRLFDNAKSALSNFCDDLVLLAQPEQSSTQQLLQA